MENGSSSSFGHGIGAQWEELVKFSKKFSNVTKVKLKHEQILNELTMFQNLTDLGKRSECESTSNSKVFASVFDFTVQVIADPDPFDSTNSFSGENIIITVQNISEIFSFNREFWYFSFDCNQGASANVWKFDKENFRPGDKEKFQLKFIPSFSSSPFKRLPAHELKISLIFSLTFNEKNFQRIFEGTKIHLDVLHLLNAGKRVPYAANDQFGTPYFCRNDTDADQLPNSTTRKYPPISKLRVKLRKSLRDKFPSIFLSDCIHRGFGNLSDFENLKQFTVFYESDKVGVSCVEDFGWLVECSTNSKLLFAIKLSIFKRILTLDGIKVEPPSDDEYSEKLCKLKLKLESCDEQLECGDFQEAFLKLREISEQIQFFVT